MRKSSERRALSSFISALVRLLFNPTGHSPAQNPDIRTLTFHSLQERLSLAALTHSRGFPLCNTAPFPAQPAMPGASRSHGCQATDSQRGREAPLLLQHLRCCLSSLHYSSVTAPKHHPHPLLSDKYRALHNQNLML